MYATIRTNKNHIRWILCYWVWAQQMKNSNHTNWPFANSCKRTIISSAHNYKHKSTSTTLILKSQIITYKFLYIFISLALPISFSFSFQPKLKYRRLCIVDGWTQFNVVAGGVVFHCVCVCVWLFHTRHTLFSTRLIANLHST